MIGDDRVSRKKITFLFFVLLLLLTSCTDKQTNIINDSKSNVEDFADVEKFLLDQLKNKPTPDLYIKLADLYRDNYLYGKEGGILAKGINEFDDFKELHIRFAQYQAFKGDGDKAIVLLSHMLNEDFDEDIFCEAMKISLETGYNMSPESYYEDFKDEIKNFDTKILLYKILASEEELKQELENNLLSSNKLEAYQAILDQAFIYRDYDKIEKLVSHLENVDGGAEYYKIYSQLLSMKDLDILDMQIGNFVNTDYMDLVVMYKNTNDTNINMVLMDGKTGNIIIDEIIENFQPDSVNLAIYEKDDKLNWLAVTSFYGMSATSGKKFHFLKFDKDKFEMIEPTFETDLEIELLADFKLKIESKKLGKKYIIDIPKSDRISYIEDEQFDNQGVPTSNGQARVYKDMYSLIYRGNHKDTISIITGFGGSHRFSADRLGFIQEIYNEIDGKFECTGIFIRDIEGLARKSELIDGVQIISLYEPEETEREDQGAKDKLPDYPKYLIEEDFKLIIWDKTINIDDNVDSIIEQIGPGEIRQVETINESATMYEYEKDGICISYIETTASGETHKYNDTILVTQPGIKTLRGLEVGIDKSELERMYGLGSLIYEDNDEMIYMYEESEGDKFTDLFVAVDKQTNKVIRFNYATNL